MPGRNLSPGYLPKICIIIFIVAISFSISFASAASARTLDLKTPVQGNIGDSVAINNASLSKLSPDTSLISTDSASKTVGVIQEQFSGIALSQRIDEIETRLNDAQTTIDELKLSNDNLKKANDNLTLTVENLQKSNDELKLYDIRQDFTMSGLETWADRHHYIITELQELESGDHQGEDYTWSVALSWARGSGKTKYTGVEPVVPASDW